MTATADRLDDLAMGFLVFADQERPDYFIRQKAYCDGKQARISTTWVSCGAVVAG